MPRNKDLKRLVRTRMKKTGEAYTTARAQITRKSAAGKRTSAARASVASTSAATPDPKDYAKLAGMSDAVIKEKTGCNWERWVKSLDRWGAEKMSHREIAAMVNKTWKIDGWWSQTVTVGYERIKGLRARGQRRDGTYEASKSRTFNAPVAELFDAWNNANRRERWLDGDGVTVRTATSPKSMRLGFSDGTIATIGFTPKGTAKSSVAVQHTKLADRETADRLKQYWSERLDALAKVLGEQ
jgi:uncharacterized protein YndB with AHSA1/START domain